MSRALDCLGVSGTRAWAIGLDETYYAPAFEVLDGELIGGAWSGWSPEQDRTVLPLDMADIVDHREAARVTLSFCVSRSDSNRATFDVALVPMGQTIANRADVCVRLAAQLLENSVIRTGAPPCSICFDGGTSNSRLNASLLGLVPISELKAYPFFKDCTIVRPQDVPYFTRGALLHAGRQA